MADNSSIPPVADRPVIVRVKRKASQSCVDAFWLEINERPIKRPLLDFAKLSISDASSSRVEESKKKVLVRHLETVTSPGQISDVLQSFEPNLSDGWNIKVQTEERRRSFKTVNKRDELLIQAKQKQEVLSRNARFEQIWRSRKGRKDAAEEESVCDKYRLYDIVRVDVEVQDNKMLEKDTDLEDYKLMAEFLPMLQDILPTAAEEIESDIHNYMSKESKQASSDGYVYDFYAVNQEASVMEVDSGIQFSLVQVADDDDYYDGPDDDEYQTDDSNAEDNPLNDYPDEDISENEDTSSSSKEESDEDESKTSGKESESESESESDKSNELKYSGRNEWSDDENQHSQYYDDMYNDADRDDTYRGDDDIYD